MKGVIIIYKYPWRFFSYCSLEKNGDKERE